MKMTFSFERLKGKYVMKKLAFLVVLLSVSISGLAQAEYYSHNATKRVVYQNKPVYKKFYQMDKKAYPRYSLGADIGGSHLSLGKDGAFKYKSIAENEYNFFKPSLGVRFNEKIGAEFFYQQSSDEDKKTSFDSSYIDVGVKYAAYGVDFLFYQPIDKQLDILMSLGAAFYDFDIDVAAHALGFDIQDSLQEDSLGMRVGLGFQFNLNRHWAARAMIHYVTMTESNDYVENIMEMSLGLRYLF